MGKKSMTKTRGSCKLKIGLNEFVDMAFANRSVDAKMICPCKHCGEENIVDIKVAKDHLKSIGSTEGCAKITGAKLTSVVPSQSSGDNKMKVVEETIDIKLFKDFVEQLFPSGLEGRNLNDFIGDFLHLMPSKGDPDKSIPMLLEYTKGLSQERAHPSKSLSEKLPFLGEEEDKKTPRMRQDHPSAPTSSSCEEEDKTTGDKRNQQIASTSSGSAGCSPREENRRKLREKINQRRESRGPRSR